MRVCIPLYKKMAEHRTLLSHCCILIAFFIMADGSFFSDLHSNIRMPETVMNVGPLPPESTAGYPYTLDGLPNARINYGSSLLGDVEPYTYGEPDQLSNQTSYLNIPNRIQKIVPLLRLPECTSMAPSNTFMLSHSVDDGDVAFVIREAAEQSKTLLNQRELDKFYSPSNYHPLINLPTVNYLLTGIQLYYQMKQANQEHQLPVDWEMFLASVVGDWNQKSLFELVYDIVQNYITPFGVVHGSEKQGGQHEGTMSPVSWACNFISTFYVDGYVRNLCNVWRNVDIRAGSHLMFQLQQVPFLDNNSFQLNHYSKATIVKEFHHEMKSFCPKYDGNHMIWILNPTVVHGNAVDKIGWRIALSYIQRKKIGCLYNCATNDKAMLNGPLLEAAFGPKFLSGLALIRQNMSKQFTPTHSSSSSTTTTTKTMPQIITRRTNINPVAFMQPIAREQSVAPAPRHSALLARTSATTQATTPTNVSSSASTTPPQPQRRKPSRRRLQQQQFLLLLWPMRRSRSQVVATPPLWRRARARKARAASHGLCLRPVVRHEKGATEAKTAHCNSSSSRLPVGRRLFKTHCMRPTTCSPSSTQSKTPSHRRGARRDGQRCF